MSTSAPAANSITSKLYWIARATEGSVQVSDDAENWRDLQSLSGMSGQIDDIKLSQPASGRYVRVLMTRPSSPYGYILSEIEVFGRGGFIAKPKPAPQFGRRSQTASCRRFVAHSAIESRH